MYLTFHFNDDRYKFSPAYVQESKVNLPLKDKKINTYYGTSKNNPQFVDNRWIFLWLFDARSPEVILVLAGDSSQFRAECGEKLESFIVETVDRIPIRVNFCDNLVQSERQPPRPINLASKKPILL